MAKPRKYRLLCPIARALDRVGDRWTLLILRDLHAGPARFSDLQSGLTGIATNLLTERLNQLVLDGLVQKRKADFGVMLYELTSLGEQTGNLLFELSRFGGRFEPDTNLQPPGNLRTIAVTLKVACERVITGKDNLTAELVVDGEPFTLTARDGKASVQNRPAESPDVTLETEYEAMVAAGDGRMSMETYVANHTKVIAHTPGKDAELMDLLGRAMQAIETENV